MSSDICSKCKAGIFIHSNQSWPLSRSVGIVDPMTKERHFLLKHRSYVRNDIILKKTCWQEIIMVLKTSADLWDGFLLAMFEVVRHGCCLLCIFLFLCRCPFFLSVFMYLSKIMDTNCVYCEIWQYRIWTDKMERKVKKNNKKVADFSWRWLTGFKRLTQQLRKRILPTLNGLMSRFQTSSIGRSQPSSQ